MKNSRQNNISLNSTGSAELDSLHTEMSKKIKYKSGNRIIIVFLIVFIVSYLFSIGLFVPTKLSNNSLALLIAASKEKFALLINYFGGEYSTLPYFDLLHYTIAAICGAALAASGVVFQGGFRNIIASPSTMGVQSGATLGNAIFLLIFTDPVTTTQVLKYDVLNTTAYSFWQMNIQQLCAIIAAGISIIVVCAVTYIIGKGRFSTANILFAGMVYSTFVGSITTVIQYYFLYQDPDDTRWANLRVLTMGSFDKIGTYTELLAVAVVVIPCLVLMFLLSSRLNALAFGEDEARTMGINTKAYRIVLIGIGCITSGMLIAFCGQIGFVGFIAPQIARRFIGNNFRRIMVLSALIGATLLIWVYNIASIFGLSEYLNIFTSAIGCTLMLYSFAKGKGGRMYE